ncbi:ABC transporter ATP-binding protein [Clostridium fungisolvens]|uniref:Putative ABC transporter ATP-binding protein YknY n=1 Tax=Clostridium fungisolvens TaxID=1604897 RepID=A0A6V8SLU2_9CLOT|nr:ABC transporter ATP-binding protein [Clostridium fungisolvens]GFP77736.1 putative ABC transporter ATP-binding protein YknY [Clostridium fungisolvens]
MAKLIEVSNLYKSFTVARESVDILTDLSFSVDKGEFLSIMGPSGCGKSTLLYLLGGLDNPSSGDIKIGEKSYINMKEKDKSVMRRKEIGFVFQFYNLVQNLSVEDNILLPLLLDGQKPKKFKKELDDILEIVGLRSKRKYTPRELSGGQQQRVAIARAVLFNPNIILADEPIGNLDSKSGTEIMELFKTINSEMSKTIIQVTHSEEAAAFGGRILQLKDGKIERDMLSA